MLKSSLTRVLPFVATAILCTVGIMLGNWQTRRAEEKELIATELQVQAARSAVQVASSEQFDRMPGFTKVKLRGQFVVDWVLYLDNRPLHGVAGFYVLMPFKLEGSEKSVLVARGWTPRNPLERTKLPELKTVADVVEIEGTVRDQLDRVMKIGASEPIKSGAIIQSLSIEDFRKQAGLHLLEKILEQTSDSRDGLRRDWPLPSSGADKHRGYAFQWYGLALMAAIFFVFTGIRRGKSRK